MCMNLSLWSKMRSVYYQCKNCRKMLLVLIFMSFIYDIYEYLNFNTIEKSKYIYIST